MISENGNRRFILPRLRIALFPPFLAAGNIIACQWQYVNPFGKNNFAVGKYI